MSVVVALVVLGGHWTNGELARHEFDSLLATTADAKSTGDNAAGAVLSTRQYTMPLLVTSSSATVRAGLEKLIDDSARNGVAQLMPIREALADVPVVPWQVGLRAARRADLAYVDQRISDFRQVTRGADLQLLNSPAAASAAAAAAGRLRAAAPSAIEAETVAMVMHQES